MKKIFVAFVLVLLTATMFGASFSVLAPKGGCGGGKPPKDEDPTPANPSIAYRGGSRDNFGLWVMDADGSHQTYIPVSDSLMVYAHCWSPDGTSIAFTNGVMNDPYLYLWCIDITVDADGNVQGSNTRQLLTEGIGNCIPAWSPNGEMIAFFRIQETANGASVSIWLYHVADGTTEKIYTDPDDTSLAGGLLYLTWDPTGTKMAFIKDTRIINSIWYPPEIRTIDIFTKTVNTVYTFPESVLPSSYSGGLDWANNDDKLAFNFLNWNNYNIANYDISESSINTLTGTSYGGSYTWSPDDSKIAYSYIDPEVKGKRNKNNINTIDVSTQEIVTLGAGSMPDWCIA
jgi:Tol biopolymer transport system component